MPGAFLAHMMRNTCARRAPLDTLNVSTYHVCTMNVTVALSGDALGKTELLAKAQELERS